jgi:hypothetical protein
MRRILISTQWAVLIDANPLAHVKLAIHAREKRQSMATKS